MAVLANWLLKDSWQNLRLNVKHTHTQTLQRMQTHRQRDVCMYV